jgi:hypothetical protein
VEEEESRARKNWFEERLGDVAGRNRQQDKDGL